MIDLNSLKLFVDNNDFLAIFPELCLTVAVLVSLFCCVLHKEGSDTSRKATYFSLPFILAGLSYCAILFTQLNGEQSIYSFTGTFLTDSFSLLVKGLILLSLLCLSLANAFYLKTASIQSKGEFQLLTLAASLGACVLCSINDFILFFVALETLSLSSVALVAFTKTSKFGSEAGLKYLINGAVASACLLFAISIFYGITLGSTSFSAFPTLLMGQSAMQFNKIFPLILFCFAMFLSVTAVGFKLSLVPFHVWAPDVYNGANVPSAAFLATISKLAAFAIFCRLGWTVFASSSIAIGLWSNIFAFIAILSMIAGNFVGAQQTFRSDKSSIKRLFAYSSIAQIGYVMSAMVLGADWSSAQGIFYLSMYVLVNLGAFLGLIKLHAFFKEHKVSLHSDSLEALNGLFQLKPKLTLFLAFCVANLAGVLPSMLLAKFILVDASLHAGISSLLPQTLAKAYGFFDMKSMIDPRISILLTATILVSSVISIYYYAVVIKKMFVDSPNQEVLETVQKLTTNGSQKLNFANWAINAAFVIVVLFSSSLSIFPEVWLTKVSVQAAKSIIVSGSNNLMLSLDSSQKK